MTDERKKSLKEKATLWTSCCQLFVFPYFFLPLVYCLTTLYIPSLLPLPLTSISSWLVSFSFSSLSFHFQYPQTADSLHSSLSSYFSFFIFFISSSFPPHPPLLSPSFSYSSASESARKHYPKHNYSWATSHYQSCSWPTFPTRESLPLNLKLFLLISRFIFSSYLPSIVLQVL